MTECLGVSHIVNSHDLRIDFRLFQGADETSPYSAKTVYPDLHYQSFAPFVRKGKLSFLKSFHNRSKDRKTAPFSLDEEKTFISACVRMDL
jgi:hypothetical protein